MMMILVYEEDKNTGSYR